MSGVAGSVRGVDEVAQRVGDLVRPVRLGVALGRIGKIAEDVRRTELVDQAGEHLGVVVAVAVVHDHAGQVTEAEVFEGGQGPVAEVVPGVAPGAGDQQVPLGLAGPTRIGVSSQHTAYARLSSVRMSLSTCTSASAVRVSRPCTHPTLGVAPVSDSTSSTQRATGIACTTIRYRHQLCRFGP